MSETKCAICDPEPCVCSELNQFLAEVQGTNVSRAAKVSLNMFDIGIGRSLATGEKLVNVMLHNPGVFDEDDPSALTLSFGKEECAKLITLLIRGYETNQWEKPEGVS